VQEFLIKKKMEQLKKPWMVKEPEVKTDVVTNAILRNPEYDFKQQIHIISMPYTIKEQIADGGLPGRILTRVKKTSNKHDNEEINDSGDENKKLNNEIITIHSSKVA